MAGANWTRKDYRVVAEELNRLKPYSGPFTTEGQEIAFSSWQLSIHQWAKVCNDNAKFTVNGNRNFDAGRFYEEATR